MTCCYKIHVRGHRQRLHAFRKKGEQGLCDQVRMIQKKVRLSQLQLEEIRRFVGSGENNVEAYQEK